MEVTGKKRRIWSDDNENALLGIVDTHLCFRAA